MFRPGFMKATAGQKNLKIYYRLFAWVYPLGRALFPASFCTLRDVARAMIHVAAKGGAKHVLEVEDIVELARQ